MIQKKKFADAISADISVVEGLLPEFNATNNKGLMTMENGGGYSINLSKQGTKQIKLFRISSVDNNLMTGYIVLSGQTSSAFVAFSLQNNSLNVNGIKAGSGIWTLVLKNNALYITTDYSSSILDVRLVPHRLKYVELVLAETSDDLSEPIQSIQI